MSIFPWLPRSVTVKLTDSHARILSKLCKNLDIKNGLLEHEFSVYIDRYKNGVIDGARLKELLVFIYYRRKTRQLYCEELTQCFTKRREFDTLVNDHFPGNCESSDIWETIYLQLSSESETPFKRAYLTWKSTLPSEPNRTNSKFEWTQNDQNVHKFGTNIIKIEL